MDATGNRQELLSLTTEIVASFAGNNPIATTDLPTLISAVFTALSNVGPGIGSLIGPAGNFSMMQDPELYILSLAMLLGRLEVLTVMVLLVPMFWRS